VNGLYIVKIRKGAASLTGAFMRTSAKEGSFAAANCTPVSDPSASTQGAASLDVLTINRTEYATTTLPIPSYDTRNLGDIMLATSSSDAQIEAKVATLLASMSLNEKAGQMAMVQIYGNGLARVTDAQVASLGIGSIFNGGSDPAVTTNTPTGWSTAIDRVQTVVMNSSPHKIPLIYGQDCVHGVGEIAGCTVFPHNIGLGCTHDTALVSQVGQITAAECAAIGIRLTFAPCVASVRNERWGRTYEGFGETPEINALMGSAYVRGLQGNGNMASTASIAACVKHYLGDGGTNDGVNSGNVTVSEATMRAVHLPQYAACAKEKMATVMPSYHSWSHGGTNWKQSIDALAMTTILKNELGFDGFCVSDFDAIPQVSASCTNYAASCVVQSVNAGMDMAMIVGTNHTNFINAVVSGVNSGSIPQTRVDDAVKRILRIKYRLNLFGNPYSNATLRGQIRSDAHRAVARQAVRESLVLLKNSNNALPLKTTDKVVVVGQWANDLGLQCAGWTISWQGQAGAGPGIAGETILSGLQTAGSSNVTYSQNGSNLSSADKVVVVVGESPYAEGQGDNLYNLDLTNCNGAGALITTCHSSGKPVIVVLISGRPMIIDGELPNCDAFVAAWLPGAEGGGVADVLYNKYNFTGTLTHSWPASYGQIPINTGTNYADEQHGSGGTPQFAYGYGLKYTTTSILSPRR
jgi:beta-glucosidase